MGGTFIILQITWSVWYLLVTVAILGSLGQELDPVLDLSHPGIHAMAGALASKAHHSHLGESRYIMFINCDILLAVKMFLFVDCLFVIKC